MKAVEERGAFAVAAWAYTFAHAGEPLPFFREHAVRVQFDPPQLLLTDSRTGEDVWATPLRPTLFKDILLEAESQQGTAPLAYRSQGYLVVPLIGHRIIGIDPVNRQVLWEKSLAGLPDDPPDGPAPLWQKITVDPRDGSVQVLHPDGWVQRLGGSLVLGPSALCLLTRAGLRAFDPLTGKALWHRRNFPAGGVLFGDADTLCVVATDADGGPTATRVFRTADGAAVNAPDFAAAYGRRLRTLGSRLLVWETEPGEGRMLRLYDVPGRTERWKHAFPARSLPLDVPDAPLAGAVAPDGTLEAFDLDSGKPVLKAALDPAHLARAEKVHLLADAGHFYVTVRGPGDPNLARLGAVKANFVPATGLHGLPVHGPFYAFARNTGRPTWRVNVENQVLVLNHFADTPLLLFTSRYLRWRKAPGRPAQVEQLAGLLALDKGTGKRLYDNPDLRDTPEFHSLGVDPRAGKVELISVNLKVRFEGGEAPATPGPGEAGK
jgi:hypothetical protein